MTQSEKLKSLIQQCPGRTEKELAKALGGPNAVQQSVNQDCRMLANAGHIERRGGGGSTDPYRYYPRNTTAVPTSDPIANKTQISVPPAPLGTEAVDVTAAWYWEGNVVSSIVRYLTQCGWEIVSAADTLSKEQGVDIHATKASKTLLIEVKGYPSKGYRDPRRADEKKPTNPTSQAQQWYSHALLKVMRLQTKHPSAMVMLGLPDFPRYRTLFEETKGCLAKLGVGLLSVTEAGDVVYSGDSTHLKAQ